MARTPNSSGQTLRLLAALLSSKETWRYGYDLSKETALKSGTLYPMLIRLEKQGWLETRWEPSPSVGRPARHMYRLNPDSVPVAAAALARSLNASRTSAKLRSQEAGA